jgi:hypothetical protein
MMVLLVITAVAAFVLVVWIAVITADGPAEGAVPRGEVEWGSLNSGAVENAVRGALSIDSSDDVDLSGLARYHAFAMASRSFAGETNPEGEDHAMRRRRLAPLFVGKSTEYQVTFGREKGAREKEVGELAAHKLQALGVSLQPGDTLGIGAAVEAGKVAVVIITGVRVATLEARPILGVPAGLWSIVGKTSPGVSSPFRGELRRGNGSWQSGGTIGVKRGLLGDPVPGAFAWELDLPEGDDQLDVRLVHEDAEVLLLTVREGI